MERGEEKFVTGVKDRECYLLEGRWDIPERSKGTRYIAWAIDSNAKRSFIKLKSTLKPLDIWEK